MGVDAWTRGETGGKINGDWNAIQRTDLHSQPKKEHCQSTNIL